MALQRAGTQLSVAADRYFPALAVPRFLLRRLTYQRRLRRSVLSTPAEAVADYVSALERDGAVLVQGFLDGQTVAAMRRAVPDMSEFVASEEGDGTLSYHDANLISAFAPFFEHPLVRETARAHISVDAIPLRQEVKLKILHGDVLCFEQFPHFDTWKRRMKAFLYLEDVDDSNGPMIYYKGSHRGLWRLPMEAKIASQYRTSESGYASPSSYYVGCFWPHEVQRLAAAHGYREMTCTGAAGTLLMFNGRGLHRATPLRSGRRLTLASYWIHRGDHT